MSLGHGQSFVSDNSAIKRHLNKAVNLAISGKGEFKSVLKSVTDIIILALDKDKKIQQNLVLQVEKLVENQNYSAACLFSNAAIRAISTVNKNEALFVGLSLPVEAIDEDVYRVMIVFASKLNYLKATSNLIYCLGDETEINYKKIEILSKIEDREETRRGLVFERLTASHLLQKQNGVVEELEIEEPSKPFAPFVLPKLTWQYRGLLKGLVSRELRTKYHKSVLGWVWAMMEPLALTLTFLLIYEIMSSNPAPYRPLSIMIGILFWAFFAQTFKRGTVFLEANIRFIQKISIPREIFLLNSCGFSIATLLLNLLALIPFLIYYKLSPSIELLLVPVVILFIALLGLGLSMFTSILHAKLRDTGQVVNVGTRVGFYFTPVFYTIDMIAGSRIPPEYFVAYLIINPIAVFLSIARTAIIGTPLAIEPIYVIIAAIETIVIFIVGSYYYQAKQDQAVKYL